MADLAGVMVSTARWSRKHAKTLVAVTAAAMVPLRLLGVSHWNSDTALAVLQNGGTASVIVGTALTLVATAALVALYGVAYAVLLVPMSTSAVWRTWAAGLPLAVLLFFAPIGPVLPLECIGAWLGCRLARDVDGDPAERSWTNRAARTALNGFLGLAIALGAAVVILLAVVGDQQWLPTETVRMQDGSVVIGWVLAAGDDVVVLRAADRHVLHRPGPPKARVICQGSPDSTGRSLAVAVHLLRTVPYEPCSESLV